MIVGIRREKRRTPRAERAVSVKLDAADPYFSAIQRASRADCEIVTYISAVARYHDIVSEVVPAFARQLLVDVDRSLRRTRVMNSDQAPFVGFRNRCENLVPRLCASLIRDCASYETHCVVDEHACGRV